MEKSLNDLFKKTEQEIKEINKRAKLEISELHKPVLDASEKLFSEIGWNKWSKEDHESDGQYSRLQKSYTDKMKLVSIDHTAKSGQVFGSSLYDIDLEGCSCSDYSYRNKPCKHMYFLARHLARGIKARSNGSVKLEDISKSMKSEYIANKTANEKSLVKGKLYGLTFVITGTFNVDRWDLKELIEKNGGKCSSSVSSRTSHLLAGNDCGSKLEKAIELGVSVITYDKLLEMIEE